VAVIEGHVPATRISVPPDRTVAAPVRPLPVLACANRGNPTGFTAPCTACGGGTVQVPLLACSFHGVCTNANKLAKLPNGNTVIDCVVCKDRVEPKAEYDVVIARF
jgi:hypothetical protein